jgi:dTDP-glucose 4,6-dehydratase
MTRTLNNILVTGGAGFIGANFIHYVLMKQPEWQGRIINLDKLTYAGNLMSLADIEKADMQERYVFVHGDICDTKLVEKIFTDYQIDTVVHFAAESHVDRSILGPGDFIKTNIEGTYNLLENARKAWTQNGVIREDVLFHHISTDEVYGSLKADDPAFSETTLYDPHSPYSASKASSDHLVMAWFDTYHLPVTLSNCSNNYGPYQFPEKLIPLMILNMLEDKALPVYGDGKNVRDWLYVEDHCEAVWNILLNGKTGEKYNVGGENEWENIKLLKTLIEIVAEKTGKDKAAIEKNIQYVQDRPGHDRRYAINCNKIKSELGWTQSHDFAAGLERTVDWYLANPQWIDGIRNGDYRKWIDANYGDRK